MTEAKKPRAATKKKQEQPAHKGEGAHTVARERVMRFVESYVTHGFGGRAAREAGYSPDSAHAQSTRLLKQPEVQKLIAERRKQAFAELDISPERVLRELYALAFLDIRHCYGEDGHLLPIKDLDPAVAAAIAGLEVVEESDRTGERTSYTKKIKLVDKKGALELLMRHLGMLKDKVQLSGDPENPLVTLLKQVSGNALQPKADDPEHDA